jgi:murein L,D-transpeptidase YafK
VQRFPRPSVAIKAAAALLLLASSAPTTDVDTIASVPVTTRLVVDKSERRLRAYAGDRLLREFKVALGRGGLAPKQQQGDRRVPEGEYTIDTRNPNSAYHLSLRISYPTPHQVKAAAERGVDPGGDIMIHGLHNASAAAGASHRRVDWTDGCIAVTNAEIEWLWQSVPDGTPISIRR